MNEQMKLSLSTLASNTASSAALLMTHFQSVATGKAFFNTSPHYYTSGHWLLVASKQNKLFLHASCGRDFTTFFPEMVIALKNGLGADHNTNVYQLIPSDLSKETLHSSLCAFCCMVTALFLYYHHLDFFPHHLTEEVAIQFVLSKYDLKYSLIKLLKSYFLCSNI